MPRFKKKDILEEVVQCVELITRGRLPRCAEVAIVEFARRCTAYERMLARVKPKPKRHKIRK